MKRDDTPTLRDLFGLRGATNTTIMYDTQTQVTVPWQQAAAAAKVRFLGYLGVVGIVVLAFISGMLMQYGYRIAAIICLIVMLVGLLYAIAAYPARKIYIKRMLREVENPSSDDTILQLAERLQPPPVIQTVREAIPYPVPEAQMMRSGKQQSALFVTIGDLIDFARGAQTRGVARRAWCPLHMSRARWEQVTHRLMESGDLIKGGDGAATWARDVKLVISELETLLEEPVP